MREDGIPEDLYAFIAKHLDSVADLEALLLLRENPSREWSASVVAKRLYISEQDATRVLVRLTQNGLLTTSGSSYRYDCRTGELKVSVDILAEAYRRQLVAITNIIHSKPRRIREFAEAFKLKKDQ